VKTRTITLILLAVGALIGVLLWRADVACSVPRHRAALKISEAAGCIEFWLNRYQAAWSSLLGAAGALIAAFIAWRAAQRQIEGIEAQNRIALGEIEPVFHIERDVLRVIITITNRSPRALFIEGVRVFEPNRSASIAATEFGFQIQLDDRGDHHAINRRVGRVAGATDDHRPGAAFPSLELHLYLGDIMRLAEVDVEFVYEFARGQQLTKRIVKRFD
jgi:hypothetical protein